MGNLRNTLYRSCLCLTAVHNSDITHGGKDGEDDLGEERRLQWLALNGCVVEKQTALDFDLSMKCSQVEK